MATTAAAEKKKRGPKFRALEPWQRLIIDEKSPKKLRKPS